MAWSSSPGMTCAIAASCGLGDEVKPGFQNLGNEITVSVYAPEWIIALTDAFHYSDRSDSVRKDISVIGTYLSKASQTERDGFTVELALIQDTLVWSSRRKHHNELIRKFASQILTDHLDMVLDDEEDEE